MDFSPRDPAAEPIRPDNLPRLPQLWIGYLLVAGAVTGEFVAVSLHPEMAQSETFITPLYLFLPIFIGIVYWLVCVHRYHVVMLHIAGWKHPISPARAVGFHFIPVYYLYWIFKWPKEIARFVNWKFQRPVMKPPLPGLMILGAFLIGPLLDPGLGLFLLFLSASYISAFLRRAIALPPPPILTSAETPPPAL